MKSIYGKLFLGFVLTLVLSFSFTGYFAIKQNGDEMSALALEELQDSTTHIADLIKLIDSEDINNILTDYAETSEMSFNVASTKENVTYGALNAHISLTNVQKTQLMSRSGESKVSSYGVYRQYAKSYQIGDTIYVISVQKDVTRSNQVFINSYIFSGVILFLAGSVVFLVVADFIVKPISRLTRATNELSKGNYKVRVNYSGNDEISKLNQAFNEMAVKLAKQEETRQQFISDVSHEFQTPLTAITGFATILKNEQLSDEQRQKYADIILFHSKRLSTLSKNMLQLTLLEGEDLQLDISSFSLIEQMNRVIETQDNAALSRDIEIEFKRPRGDILIDADESRMEQVWINLISNAIKYTNNHGVVTIEIKKLTKEIEVKISDTGVGMSKEAISHIFERFYRQDKSRTVEGNGLGLSIVKRILDLHHFGMDVASQEDVGSVFTVHIPYERLGEIAKKLNIKKDRESGKTNKEN